MLSGFYIDGSPAFFGINGRMDSSRETENYRKRGFIIRHSGLVSPFDVVPVIISGSKRKPDVIPMKWGIKGKKGPYHVLFYDIHHSIRCPSLRRCVIPVSWFYDDEKPWLFSSGEEISFLAGAYYEKSDKSFAILTGSDGLPVMFRKNDVEDWVYPDIDVYRVLEKTMPVKAFAIEA